MLRKASLTVLTLLLVLVLITGCGPVAPGSESSTTTSPTTESTGQIAEVTTNKTTMTPMVTPTTTPSTTQLTMLSITNGTVLLMKEGSDTWVEAQVGMSLELSDTIKTGDDSSALITLFEGNTIELQPGTQIKIDSLEFVEATGSFAITLQQEIGKTVSRITQLTDTASSYEIETSAGIAAVLGSAMLVHVNVHGVTWVTNLHGTIRVFAQGVWLQIPGGMIGKIVPGETPILVLHPEEKEEVVNTYVSAIDITKLASPSVIYSGDEVTYTYRVTNPGDNPLSGVSVTDDQGLSVSFVSGDENGNNKLDPGESWIYTASAFPTEDVTNIGTVTATDSAGATLSDDDSATVDVIYSAISITKLASPLVIYAGEEVLYNYWIRNPGQDSLSNVSVSDDQGLSIIFVCGDLNENNKLDPGETWLYSAGAKPMENVTNIGTVTATNTAGRKVSDQDSAFVEVLTLP